MFNSIIIFIIILFGIYLIYKIADTIYVIASERLSIKEYHIFDLNLGGTDEKLFELFQELRYLDINDEPTVEIITNIDNPHKIKRYMIGCTDRLDIINNKTMRVYLKINNISDHIKEDLVKFIEHVLKKYILGVSLMNDTESDDKKYNVLVFVVEENLPNEYKTLLKKVGEECKND